jgi:hypothetical protein
MDTGSGRLGWEEKKEGRKKKGPGGPVYTK